VKNITVSVPDEVYRNARVAAAQRDTSVSALVVAYLEQLSGRMDEFARLETLQHEVQAGIRQFRATTARTIAASGSPIRSAEKTEQRVPLSFARRSALGAS